MHMCDNEHEPRRVMDCDTDNGCRNLCVTRRIRMIKLIIVVVVLLSSCNCVSIGKLRNTIMLASGNYIKSVQPDCMRLVYWRQHVCITSKLA